jgi:hypothetical protein
MAWHARPRRRFCALDGRGVGDVRRGSKGCAPYLAPPSRAVRASAARQQGSPGLKTVLDLLDLDFIFSQQGPLSVDDFLKKSQERSVNLERGHLDALHRAGIVVPMYRIARDMKAVRSWVRHERRSGHWEPASQAPDAHIFTNCRGLRAHHAAGCIAYPRSEPYLPWRQYATKIGLFPRLSPDGTTFPEMMNSSEFLYSPYQSLQLTDLTPVIARMRVQRRGRHAVYAVSPQNLVGHAANNWN